MPRKTSPQNTISTSPLYPFLQRHPWSSDHLLSQVFSTRVVIDELMNNAQLYRSQEIYGQGRCYALAQEPDATLVGIPRWDLARRFMLRLFQIKQKARDINIYLTGLSPGIEADGDFLIPSQPYPFFYRLWVDLGGCEAPALSFIRNPPKYFGTREDQKDIILTTDAERISSLKLQLMLNWNSSSQIQIWAVGTDELVPISLRGRSIRKTSIPSVSAVQKHLKKRLSQKVAPQDSLPEQMGRLSVQCSPIDWLILERLGNVPLLTETELVLVLNGGESMLERIEQLKKKGLIAYADNVSEKGRLFLTSTAVELLRRRWNLDSESMRCFQKWPLIKQEQLDLLFYSARAVDYNPNHNRWTREFCLSLIGSAKRISTAEETLAVELLSTTGARIIYPLWKASERGKKLDYGYLCPDAILRARFWRDLPEGARQPGGLAKSCTSRLIYFELDRSTVGDLNARLEAYRHLYGTISTGVRPLLLWLIDGSEHRESQILQLMADRKLPGYTVQLNRLIRHSTVEGKFKSYQLDLLGDIWRSPGKEGWFSIVKDLALG